MSLVTDLKVFLFANSVLQDITDGILSVNWEHGITTNQGIGQVPDTGQLVLVSRNSNLDPYVNPDVRFNSKIYVEYSGLTLFYGSINNINVEYGSFNEDTIITINVVDQIAILQQYIYSADDETYFRNNYPDGLNFYDFCYSAIPYNDIDQVFIRPWIDYQTPGPGDAIDYFPITDTTDAFSAPKARVAIKEGDNVWDTFTKLLQSNLLTITYQSGRPLIVFPYVKYNADYWFYQDNVDTSEYYINYPISFSSTGDGIPFKSIVIDDGFDRTINPVTLSNSSIEYGTGNTFIESSMEYGPYINEDSKNNWGPSSLNISTVYSGLEDTQNTYDNLAFDILEFDSVPKLDIKEISVDALKYFNTSTGLDFYNNDTYPIIDSSISLNSPYTLIRIKHKINNSLFIDKFYTPIGAKHAITPNSYEITFILKEYDLYRSNEGQIQKPSISINATSGDTNFNFSASVTNFPSEKIARIDWNIAGQYSYLDELDRPIIENTLNPTWNYDVVAPNPPLDWQGPGYKEIVAKITTTDGWVVFSESLEIEVTSAYVHASFTYTKDVYDGINFIDASINAETWLWNFGDGTTSTLQNPPIKYYETTGTKTVSLTVSDGITSNTFSLDIDITQSKIPVKYVKYEFKGIRNKVGGVWDKEFIRYFSLIQASGTAGDSISYNAPTTIVATKGTARVYPSNNVLPSPNKYITDSVFANPLQSTDIKLDPLVTNGGNTEEYDISFILDISKVFSTTGPDGIVYTSANRTAWSAPNNNERFKLTDSLFIPKNWATNIHYQPINVYVSADGTNYYKIGDQNVYTTSYPPSGTTKGWTLDNKVPMPPRFPT